MKRSGCGLGLWGWSHPVEGVHIDPAESVSLPETTATIERDRHCAICSDNNPPTCDGRCEVARSPHPTPAPECIYRGPFAGFNNVREHRGTLTTFRYKRDRGPFFVCANHVHLYAGDTLYEIVESVPTPATAKEPEDWIASVLANEKHTVHAIVTELVREVGESELACTLLRFSREVAKEPAQSSAEVERLRAELLVKEAEKIALTDTISALASDRDSWREQFVTEATCVEELRVGLLALRAGKEG